MNFNGKVSFLIFMCSNYTGAHQNSLFGCIIKFNGWYGKNYWPYVMWMHLLFYIFPFKHNRIKKGQKCKNRLRMSVGCKREIFHIVKKMFIVYYYQNQCWMHFSFTMFFTLPYTLGFRPTQILFFDYQNIIIPLKFKIHK